jgi:hypothetical protein
MATSGNGCGPAEQSFGGSHGTDIYLVPDLAQALGCVPTIPTKVRCLDAFRTSMLALGMPRQCAISPPKRSPFGAFGGWMNIRELRWHGWGDERRAWAKGVIVGVPARLRHNQLPIRQSSLRTDNGTRSWPPAVRIVASGRVSCGTSYFYSKLHVISQFGRFAVTLPTCPDQFYAPV